MPIALMVDPPELPFLTPRERTGLLSLGRGLTDKEVAIALNLTVSTARSYVADLIRKTRLNRHQLGIAGFLQLQAPESVQNCPLGT